MIEVTAPYDGGASSSGPTILREVELRYVGARRKSDQIADARGVARLARKIIPDGPREILIVLFLDAKNRTVGWYRFCGGLAFAVVAPVDIFRAAVHASAHSIVLVHNHPSGEVTPSGDDVTFTERVRAAGALLGIGLLDHVVLGDDGCHFSFLDAGLLK